MNKQSIEVIGLLIGLITLVVAILAWIAPFGPVGPSPLASQKTITVTTQSTTSSLLNVYANQSWNNTNLNVKIDDTVKIEYQSGSWTYWPGKIAPFDASGDPQPYVCANIEPASQCIEPLPEANKGSLIARVGATKPIYIGRQSNFVATSAGLLELSMNDSVLSSDYSKDEGYVAVRITITKP